MGQDVMLQQALQALLQGGLMSVSQVGDSDEGFTEVSIQDLPDWAVHL